MKKYIFYLQVAVASILLFSCKGKTTSEPDDRVSSVCVYNYSKYGLPLLENINDPKSTLTTVKLGESLYFLGEIAKDTLVKSNKEFSKIELSDGATGWSRSDYIIKNINTGAIINETPVYDRPDILTRSSNKKYKEIDFVAVIEEKGDWIRVVGINNLNQGWIMKKDCSYRQEDVAMSILARKEIFDKNGNIIEDKLADFIANAPYPESNIVSILRSKLPPDENYYDESSEEEITDEDVSDDYGSESGEYETEDTESIDYSEGD